MKNKEVNKGTLSLSEFRQMEVIDISEGRRLGFIGDIIFDEDFTRIDAFVIPLQNSFFSMFRKSEEIIIKWEQVKVIGQDIILVDMKVKNGGIEYDNIIEINDENG